MDPLPQAGANGKDNGEAVASAGATHVHTSTHSAPATAQATTTAQARVQQTAADFSGWPVKVRWG